MNNYKVVLEYAGENYHGFAKQPNLLTIQGILEDILSKILKENIYIIGAGRTDAKVNALGQVINFETKSKISSNSLLKALNSNLPKDIVAKNVEIVDNSFHSRYSAKSKKYMYIINTNSTPSALNINREFYCKYKLDLNKLMKAASILEGKHDFSAFMNSGTTITDTIREIYSIKIIEHKGIIKIIFEGNGFLYNQVRIMVGTLIEVARGIKEVADIKTIIDSKNRAMAGVTAEPQGLYLLEVLY